MQEEASVTDANLTLAVSVERKTVTKFFFQIRKIRVYNSGKTVLPS